jgi:hypothetical protein
MKIDGPGSVRPGQVKKAQKSAAGGAEFLRHMQGDESEAAARVGGAATVFGVSPLIGLQEVDDALQGRRKARQRAADILDRLDEIRVGLLNGSIPREKLHELVRILQVRRQTIDDPKLQAVIDEIDLRAQVEIAKLAQNG